MTSYQLPLCWAPLTSCLWLQSFKTASGDGPGSLEIFQLLSKLPCAAYCQHHPSVPQQPWLVHTGPVRAVTFTLFLTGTRRTKYILYYDPVHTHSKFLSFSAPPQPHCSRPSPVMQTSSWGWVRCWPLLCRHRKALQVSVWEPPHFTCGEKEVATVRRVVDAGAAEPASATLKRASSAPPPPP